MVCVATASEVVVKVAVPLVTATPEASVVEPSVKVTEPVGVPPDELIVAVKVTDCPGPDGLADDVTAVVVGVIGAVMLCVSMGSIVDDLATELLVRILRERKLDA